MGKRPPLLRGFISVIDGIGEIVLSMGGLFMPSCSRHLERLVKQQMKPTAWRDLPNWHDMPGWYEPAKPSRLRIKGLKSDHPGQPR